MTRRALLSLFAAAPAALALDPEKLLWTPGRKLISVPPVVTVPRWRNIGATLTIENGDLFTTDTLRWLANGFNAVVAREQASSLKTLQFQAPPAWNPTHWEDIYTIVPLGTTKHVRYSCGDDLYNCRSLHRLDVMIR